MDTKYTKNIHTDLTVQMVTIHIHEHGFVMLFSAKHVIIFFWWLLLFNASVGY